MLYYKTKTKPLLSVFVSAKHQNDVFQGSAKVRMKLVFIGKWDSIQDQQRIQLSRDLREALAPQVSEETVSC